MSERSVVRQAAERLKNISPRAFRVAREWHRSAVARKYRGDLIALATYYGTDKWNDHWYAEIYDDHFRDLRDQPLNVLEIGVGGYDHPQSGGASLRMWKAYFRRSQIHGIDIYDKRSIEERRITVWQGSQVDRAFMSSVFAAIGRVDILIDDGSHINAHVIETFNHCLPLLAPGGIYAIEDVHTSYLPEYGGKPRIADDQTTIMGHFKRLTDAVNSSALPGQPDTCGGLTALIRAIHFYRDLILVERAGDTELRTVPANR
jgi:cephalosporin hydroxylase